MSTSHGDEITERIRLQVNALIECKPLLLPEAQAALVQSFIEKIENGYNLADFQGDTDHAIDLLIIAYNITPHDQDKIRIQINKIIDKLITAQQDSERAITNAVKVAQGIHAQLGEALPAWLKVRGVGQLAQLRPFVSETLLAMGKDIAGKAAQVRQELASIAQSYNAILDETLQAKHDSEIALGEFIKDNEAFALEYQDAEKRRQEIDKLAAEIHGEVERYEQQVLQSKLAMSILIALGVEWVSTLLPHPVFKAVADVSIIAACRFSNVCQAQAVAEAHERGRVTQEQANSILRRHITLLERVKKYEQLCAVHEDELSKIKALLVGCCREKKTVELGIRAFNLSLRALTRNIEIVEVMEFFFRSFADFMVTIVADGQARIDLYEDLEQTTSLGPNRIEHLIRTTDGLFIEQAGQWLAVAQLGDLFARSFNVAWLRLNKLSGQYLLSTDLDLHLDKVIDYLNKLGAERDQRRTSRLNELQGYLEIFHGYLDSGNPLG
ncbi:hypothetical protein [Pseudomonas putida]|uniref:hypothetical protein n=1 Tax=Pseudomonas putida TaxID=303 RepID=UPI003905FC46